MLLIDRHNYEEYFLLYVDNELIMEDRRAVEEFLKNNEDLLPEMEALQQAVLDSEPILFYNKEELIRRETGITQHNAEEYFLLYVDNELNKQEKERVEQFVLKHPALQNDFMLLQKTRLPKEEIEFKNKSVLERKERRVIPIWWLRMSVAAAITGFIAFSWWMAHDDFSVNGPSTATTLPPVNVIYSNKPVQQKASPLAINAGGNKDNNVAVNMVQASSKRKQLTNSHSPSVFENAATRLKVPQKNETDIWPNTPEENVAVAIPNISEPRSINGPKTLISAPVNPIAENAQVITANAQQNTTPAMVVSNSTYTEIVETEEDDNPLFVGNVQVNKKKIKALFSKASGLFGKKKDKEPTDKSLKVAGFEVKTI